MPPDATIGVGIIGLGTRGMYSIARLMADDYDETRFQVVALCDRNADRLVESQAVIAGRYAISGLTLTPRLYRDGLELIRDPDVDLVVVTSPTDTHREFVVPALHAGKKVYCDKPLAHTVEDAVAIVDAERETRNPLIMGFTRRYEAVWLKAHELVDQGEIGRLVMLQVRDVIPYHRYLTAWWRRREWSGGALNDKGSHLFDVFNWFAGSQAVKVHGFGGRDMIRPDPSAPSRCHQCDRDCPYRRREYKSGTPAQMDIMVHFGPSWLQETEEQYIDDVCVYAPGADLYHNASIHVSYANGMIASYFYTIFGPPAKDEETLELVGTQGRIILTRHTGSLDIVNAYGKAHRVLDCRDAHFEDSHFGADLALVRELRRFCEGAPPTVSARAGLEATRLVMASLQSMDAGGATVDVNGIPNA